MSITLTANYKETLNVQTVEFIEERLEDNYALDDMLEFIDTYNEDDFCNYYEESLLNLSMMIWVMISLLEL